MLELISYYVNLLIIQYHNKPNAKATIEALVTSLIASGIYTDVRDGYDLDTAVGTQLDVLGKYEDIDRFYQGQDFSGNFGLLLYDEVDAPPSDREGFTTYADFETKEGAWLNYIKLVSDDFILPDEDFRQLIKLRIIQNNSNHSHKEIDDAVYEFFEATLIPDSGGNMVMNYFITEEVTEFAFIAFQKEALPRPAAVKLNYFIEIDPPWFGFTTYSEDEAHEYTSGFTTYADYDTKEGNTLRYLQLLEV